jgi:spermidine synthase
MLDAYHHDSIPFHLTTREFFQTVNQKLTTDGVTVINVIGSITGSKSKIVRSLIKTLRETFPQIYVFPTLGADFASIESVQNIIIIASKNKERLDIGEIVKRAASLGSDLFPDPVEEINASYYEANMLTDDVPVLTDDYAPTDSLLHR